MRARININFEPLSPILQYYYNAREARQNAKCVVLFQSTNLSGGTLKSKQQYSTFLNKTKSSKKWRNRLDLYQIWCSFFWKCNGMFSPNQGNKPKKNFAATEVNPRWEPFSVLIFSVIITEVHNYSVFFVASRCGSTFGLTTWLYKTSAPVVFGWYSQMISPILIP